MTNQGKSCIIMDMSKNEYQARIAELISKGFSPKIAEKRANKERRLRSPQHKAAVARRVEAATMRFEATGEFKF